MARSITVVNYKDTQYRIKQFGYLESMKHLSKIGNLFLPLLTASAKEGEEGADLDITELITSVINGNIIELAEYTGELLSGVKRNDSDSDVDWDDELAGDFGLTAFLIGEVVVANYKSFFTIGESLENSSLTKLVNQYLPQEAK